MKDPSGAVVRDITDVMTRKGEDASPDLPPATDPSELLPEQRVLDQHLGNWKQTTTTFPAEWTPERAESTGTDTCNRALKGLFVYQKNVESDGSTQVHCFFRMAGRSGVLLRQQDTGLGSVVQ